MRNLILILVLVLTACGQQSQTGQVADPLNGGCPAGHFGALSPTSLHFDETHFSASMNTDFSGTFSCDSAAKTMSITITHTDQDYWQDLGTYNCEYSYDGWDSVYGGGFLRLYCTGAGNNELDAVSIYYSTDTL